MTVTGRLMPDETTAASGIKDVKGLPHRQVMLINSAQQARSWAGRSSAATWSRPAPARRATPRS